jgi:hypothetical protein
MGGLDTQCLLIFKERPNTLDIYQFIKGRSDGYGGYLDPAGIGAIIITYLRFNVIYVVKKSERF